jgi:hypothetical protein
MEAKLKAEELFEKMLNTDLHCMTKFCARQCALIAVDEICEAIHYHYDNSTDIEWNYWQQVKTEINNL